VEGHANQSLPDDDDLAGVQPGANQEAQSSRPAHDLFGAADRSRRTVEGRETPIDRSGRFLTTEVVDRLARQGVVTGAHLGPLSVAEASGDYRGIGKLHRQHGGQDAVGLGRRADASQEVLDLVQDGVLIADEGEVVVAR
jgi:hypothetical protein